MCLANWKGLGRKRPWPIYRNIPSFYLEGSKCFTYLIDLEEFCLVWWNAVYSSESQPTFQKNISPPCSGSESKAQRKPAWSRQLRALICLLHAGLLLVLFIDSKMGRYVPLMRRLTSAGRYSLSQPSVTAQKMEFFTNFLVPQRSEVHTYVFWLFVTEIWTARHLENEN